MAKQIEIYVVIHDGINQYYLLKVVRRGYDVYCFPPHLGVHVSVHASGRMHFTREEGPGNGDQIPVALMLGEAGRMEGRDIVTAPLRDQGRASCICTAIYPIVSIADDFSKFENRRKKTFVIDARSLPEDTTGLTIGVWAVPHCNEPSFHHNIRDIPETMLFKSDGDPQIWIYAQPF